MVAIESAPAYDSTPRGPTPHSFDLQYSEVGLAVNFFSFATNPTSTPAFYDENVVTGTVQVSFQKKRKIDSISVKLHGYQKLDMMQWLDKEEKDHDRIFLELTKSIWPPPDMAGDASLAPGKHTWPFSFTFPKETVNLGRSGSTYALPPSFAPVMAVDHIVYELVVTARRGSFFHEDEFLTVPVRYLSRPVAAMPSPARVLSYRNGDPLVAPDADVEGWTTKSLVLRGKLFGRSQVEVACDLSLASPLDYPRGYPIPFVVSLRSDDPQALALFAAPNGVAVSLSRLLVRFKRARGEEESEKSKEVARGQYWPVHEEAGMRVLQGEIMVPLQTAVGFSYKTLSVLYHISLTPSVAGFDVKDLANGAPAPTLAVPVKIAYFPPPNVRPRSYAPPEPYSEAEAPPPVLPPQANLVSVA